MNPVNVLSIQLHHVTFSDLSNSLPSEVDGGGVSSSVTGVSQDITVEAYNSVSHYQNKNLKHTMVNDAKLMAQQRNVNIQQQLFEG